MINEFEGRVENVEVLKKCSEPMRKQCAISVNNVMIVKDTFTYQGDVSKFVDVEQGDDVAFTHFHWIEYWCRLRVQALFKSRQNPQPITLFGKKYSRTDKVKFFKGCLPQILLSLFLNTLSHLYIFKINLPTQGFSWEDIAQ